MNSRLLIALLLFATIIQIGAAQDRYMVFFTDKENTPYSISSPEEFLSERSLDRRSRHGVTLSEEDLPVDPAYVSAVQSSGAQVFFRTKWMNAVLVTIFPENVSAIEALEFVDRIELVGIGGALTNNKQEFSVADTFEDNVLVVSTSNAQNSMLGADQLLARGATGKGLFVAVFDAGFDGVLDNYAFKRIHENNRIKAELDFIQNTGNPYQYHTHGTRVLSCISGQYKDQFTGTAPDVDLILAVTEDWETEYPVEMYNWLFAAEHADSAGVDIINSSVGYVDFDPPFESWTYTFEDLDGQTSVIAQAANWASERGILVVNSAGNSGSDGDVDGSTFESCSADPNRWCRINTPSDSPHVLAVGAVQSDGITRAYFSSYGPSFDNRIKPDVSAMGFETAVANNTGLIIPNAGTSFSAPLIAGFAASIWQAYPDLTNSELHALLRSSGDLSDNPNNELGYGVPKFLEIRNELGEPYLLTNSEFKGIRVFPNPFESTLKFEGVASRHLHYTLMDYHGKTLMEGEVHEEDSTLSFGNSLKSGLYFLVLKSGGFSETIKLLKK